MAIEISYRDDGGVVAVGRGVVTGSELIKLNEQIYETTEKTKRIRYQLCDLSAIDGLEASTPDLRTLALQDDAAANTNPSMLIAVIVSEDLGFGLSRMWEAYAEQSPLKRIVVRKMEDAELWVQRELGAGESG